MDSNDSSFSLPQPNVFLIAGDDLSWTVRCDLNQIVELFRQPASWMEALSRAAGQTLTLASNYTVQMKSPGVYKAGQDEDGEGLVVVTGISGTSIIQIRPSALTSEAGLKLRENWQTYWDEWIDDKITPFQVSILTEDALVFGHLQLAKEGDPQRADRMACFMLTASSDLERFNALLAKRPPTPEDVNVVPPDGPEADQIKQERKSFESVTAEQLTNMTFLLVSEQRGDFEGSSPSFCLLTSGQWVQDNQSMFPNGATIKDYAAYVPGGEVGA